MYRHSPKKLNPAETHTQKMIKSNMLLLEVEIDDIKHGLITAKQEGWSKDSVILYMELILDTMTEKFKYLSHNLDYDPSYLNNDHLPNMVDSGGGGF